MQIHVDSETTGIELYHLSILFQSLAKARGHDLPKPIDAPSSSASRTNTIGEMSATLNVDTSNVTSAVEALADLIDRTGVKVEDVPAVTVSVESPDIVVVSPGAPVVMIGDGGSGGIVDNLDSAGLPWDARIHAGSRERNTDGSWRVRRRPKGVEEAEWEATLARINAELRDLMEIPVTPGAVADAAAEEALTDAEIDHFVDIVQGVTGEIDQHGELVTPVGFVEPPVVVAPPAIAPPVVIPPVTAVAPPIATASPAIETFAQVMTYLTARTPKDEAAKPAMVAKVNEILAANGLTVLTQLGQRPDLIPQVVEQFKAAFGE